MNPPQPTNPAEMYERYFVPAMFRPWAAILLGHAAPQPLERVLDVACGTGIVARQAAALVGRHGQVVGLDVNPAMLAVARAMAPPSGVAIDWQQGNAMSMPFADGSFDLVLCQHGLQFVPDRVGVVRQMRRVLAPGGRALVMTLQSLDQHPVFQALMNSVANHLALPLAAVMTPFALSDSGELGAFFVSAGFRQPTVISATTAVRFPESHRFVPLAVTSSAAAIPAFLQLEAPQRAALLQAVGADLAPLIKKYCDGDVVTFPMFAHIVLAHA
jgi:ubiquinone/menaquinone biosynthesis C-methylase UbiE